MPKRDPPAILLPKSWLASVRSALLHVIALAQYATVSTRSWAANSLNARVRLQAENGRLRQEVALPNEEIQIKDARMLRIEAHRRPHYPPTDRMADLELRAARGWSQQQTADVIQVTAATVASWWLSSGFRHSKACFAQSARIDKRWNQGSSCQELRPRA